MIRRIVTTVILFALAVLLFIVAWPVFFTLERTFGVAQVLAFRGGSIAVAIILALLVFLVAVSRRGFDRHAKVFVALLVIFAIANAGILFTRGFGETTFAAKGKSDLTVMAWNTLGGTPGAQTIADLAVKSQADIVALPETSKATADAVAALMTAAGHPMTPYSIELDKPFIARSTSVLVSTKLGGYTIDSKVGSTSPLPTVVLRPVVPTAPVIVAVHAVAPNTTADTVKWASDLNWLNGACSSTNVVMAGDFNATIDHLLDVGAQPGAVLGSCTDAGLESKNAAVGSWPTSLPALLGTPIDHVMYTANWRVSGMQVIENLDTVGSDHRPIIAQLTRVS